MKKAGKIIWFVICFCMVAFSGVKLYGIYSGYRTGTKAYEKLEEQYIVIQSGEATDNGKNGRKTSENEDVNVAKSEEPVTISVDFTELKEVYGDVIAWIYCPNTPINYPVVQSTDNDYYLHRLITGEYNAGGTLFMDFRNSSDFSDWNSIIYGHNMKNDSMFGILPDYMEQEFYEEHPVWYLVTEEYTYQIELVGGYVTAADSSSYDFPEDAAGRDTLANMASRKSSFRSDVKVEEEDRLVTMSTCVYDYEDSRYVLVGILREFGQLDEES